MFLQFLQIYHKKDAKMKPFLGGLAIFPIFYLFIYVQSLGFRIHLFIHIPTVCLLCNRHAVVNKTGMSSWSFHSRRSYS